MAKACKDCRHWMRDRHELYTWEGDETRRRILLPTGTCQHPSQALTKTSRLFTCKQFKGKPQKKKTTIGADTPDQFRFYWE
jgi:hypothetical protein